jgi:AraC-like DNA-binding protein
MQQSVIHIYLSSAVICLLLAVGILASKKLQVLPVRILGIIYGLCAIQNFLAVAILGLSWEFAASVRAAIAMTLGPAVHFYYTSLIGREFTGSPTWLLHLLPAVLVLGAWAFYTPVLWILDYLIIGSFGSYLFITIKLLIDGKHRLEHLAQYANAAYRWLVILAVLMIINLLVEVLVYLELHSGASLKKSWSIWLGASIFLIFHATTLVLLITRAPLTEWMHALQDLRLSKTKTISDEHAREVFERWQRIVAERELYKREDGITLEQAGRILAIPARQISQAINRIYGSSFSQYLNDCRVETARSLLRDHKDTPITTLMLEAGFNTKSSFNKEFLRVTGLTPSEYRKQAEIS